VLTNAQGLTLYYRTTDKPTSVCSGTCARTWIPLLLPSGTPTASTRLSGTLSTLTDANGRQVTYNGHPLYHYVGDSKPGQATGQGVAGIWFVATPSLKP
jgi:predicted lipoprotein with Yx(FWY)xxD motif